MKMFFFEDGMRFNADKLILMKVQPFTTNTVEIVFTFDHNYEKRVPIAKKYIKMVGDTTRSDVDVAKEIASAVIDEISYMLVDDTAMISIPIITERCVDEVRNVLVEDTDTIKD